MSRQRTPQSTPAPGRDGRDDEALGKAAVYSFLAAFFFLVTALVYAAEGRSGPVFYLSAVSVPLWVANGVRRLWHRHR